MYAPSTSRVGRLGAHIRIHRTWWGSITSVIPGSERILLLRLKNKGTDVIFVSVHAPTEEAGGKERVVLYRRLEKVLRRPKKNILLVLLR